MEHDTNPKQDRPDRGYLVFVDNHPVLIDYSSRDKASAVWAMRDELSYQQGDTSDRIGFNRIEALEVVDGRVSAEELIEMVNREAETRRAFYRRTTWTAIGIIVWTVLVAYIATTV